MAIKNEKTKKDSPEPFTIDNLPNLMAMKIMRLSDDARIKLAEGLINSKIKDAENATKK